MMFIMPKTSSNPEYGDGNGNKAGFNMDEGILPSQSARIEVIGVGAAE